MTIYNFNQGIGWASSGVEYAQAYRSNIFKKNHQTAKFIFTDMFNENIEPMTENLGFESQEIIWLYQYFTDIKISPTTYTREKLETQFSAQPDSIERFDRVVTYFFKKNNLRVNAYLGKSLQDEVVYKTEIFIGGNLTQRDYYSYVKVFSEYFKPVNQTINLYQRRFFNENGSIAYDEMLSGQQSLFVFKDRTIFSKEKLVGYFLECLNLSSKDILIIDRSTGMGPEIMKNKGVAKVGVVIHADHYCEPMTSATHILWNNYYEYQFDNAKEIDFFVTATDAQKKLLELQFATYNKGPIKIYSIPVGSLNRLTMNNDCKSGALITASRLASEKHLDWLVRAVVDAKKVEENITLDIYGEGGEEVMLRDLISDLGAEDYINLKGQHDLTNVYANYETYITASTSEGFGLTLLEAVGSGLGMIGFDVRYGNQTFINNGENGFLLEFSKNNDTENISKLTEAIIKFQKTEQNEMVKVQKESYAIAEKYLTDKVRKKWLKLEKEIINA